MSIPTINIVNVRSMFNGQLITPKDDGYDQARKIFYSGIERRPALIARPADAAGVGYVIALARDSGMELAVRSGGHSNAGHGVTEGGIVLDLKDLHNLQVDVKKRTAWAESGLTAGEYTAEVGKHDLATGFGDTGSVGIGGITLGGGIGFLVRKYGMTIDSLLGAEIVTADGRRLHTDAENHPDLFWAIRGGGGNFGVVTRFQYRLHDVSSFMGGMMAQPATPETIASFIELAEAAPEGLSTIANVMVAPPAPFLPPEVHGKLVLFSFLAFVGDVEAGERVIQPFRKLATAYMDTVKAMKYPEMYQPEDESYHPKAVSRTLFINQVERPTAEKIIHYLEASDASLRVAQLRVLGGAMRRVPKDATAFAHRDARIMVSLAAFYEGADDKPRRVAWVNEFESAMQQGYGGAYVNFMGEEGGARIQQAYPGKTGERLAAIKAKYDPENLFHMNHNITPVNQRDDVRELT